MAATALIRLGKLLGNATYLESAGRTLAFAKSTLEKMSTASGQMLIALDLWRGPIQELVLIGGQSDEENRELQQLVHNTFLPNAVVALRPTSSKRSASLEPLFADRKAINGQPTLFICHNFACQAPIFGAAQIKDALGKL
jgi:uncharacterized protein YyaL (SSP411 family)